MALKQAGVTLTNLVWLKNTTSIDGPNNTSGGYDKMFYGIDVKKTGNKLAVIWKVDTLKVLYGYDFDINL